MNTDNLNYLDQAQGVMPWDSNVSPNGLIAQRRAQAFAAPMAFPDSSGALNAGQNSQSQALGMMNTPGVGQPQLQHGLIGRAFDNVKGNMLPFGGTDGVQQKLQGAMQQNLPNRDSTISNFIQNNKPQKPQNDQTGDYNNYV